MFDDLWQSALDAAGACNISTEPVPKRKKILSSKLQAHYVLSTVGHHPSTTYHMKDHIRTGIYNQVLDRMLVELGNRFSKHNCQIMRGIQYSDFEPEQ